LDDPKSLSLLKKGLDPDLYLALKRSNILKEFNINTLIDIGAYKGKFSYVVNILKLGVKILAFEPLELHYAELMNYPFLDDVFTVALGDVEGQLNMFVTHGSHSSSLLKPTDVARKTFGEALTVKRMEKVPLKRLDDLISPHCFKREILVKIDVQGQELKVIRGGFNVLSCSKVAIVEVSFKPLYEHQSGFSDIHDALVNLVFENRGPLLEFRDNSRLVVFEDALFIRE